MLAEEHAIETGSDAKAFKAHVPSDSPLNKDLSKESQLFVASDPPRESIDPFVLSQHAIRPPPVGHGDIAASEKKGHTLPILQETPIVSPQDIGSELLNFLDGSTEAQKCTFLLNYLCTIVGPIIQTQTSSGVLCTLEDEHWLMSSPAACFASHCV